MALGLAFRIGMAVLAGAAAGSPAMAAGPTLVRIPTLGGSGSVALDINDNGSVVGQANVLGDIAAHGFYWKAGVITDLGALAPEVESSAWAINNNEEIVGWSTNANGLGSSAMYWHDGATTNINAAMGAAGSVAWDINDRGVVVGQGNLGPGFSKGFVWSADAGGVSAGTLPGFMGGANKGINNDGVIVGHSFFFGDPDKAHMAYPSDRGGYDDSFEIGPGGYGVSIANDINNHGIAVGYADQGAHEFATACIYTLDRDNPIIDLGTLPGFWESNANAINDAGVIVGFAYPANFDGDPHAWAYFGGAMHDLNDFLDSSSLGGEFVTLLNATGLNNKGDIVGSGLTVDGQIAGFVLSGVVPSPAGVGLFAICGVAFARRRRVG